MNRTLTHLVWSLVLGTTTMPLFGAAPPTRGPVELRVDNLPTPLGIDDPAPHFSWQLRDPAQGARQTAYQVDVASTAAALNQGKADVWTSGRENGAQSLNVSYHGPTLKPGKRYYWRVKVWDAAGKAYPQSETSWWETGLLIQDAWNAPWIGYETPEEAAREGTVDRDPRVQNLVVEKGPEQHSHIAVGPLGQARCACHLRHARHGVGVGNGAGAARRSPAALQQMPWKKYVSATVGKQLRRARMWWRSIVHCCEPNGMANNDAPPLNATLYVEYEDGTNATSPAARHKDSHSPRGDWRVTNFDDSG
jgi:alpha-L-rhamnosidase